MPIVRPVMSFLLSLLFALTCDSAQQPSSNAGQSSQRDSQALAILAQCLGASGGTTALAGIQDFTAIGTITYNWANVPVSGPVTVYGKGLNEFRMDANVSGGTQSLIVGEGGGSSTNVSGQKVLLPFYSIVTAGSLTFPAARTAAALNDPSTAISYVGSVVRNGSQVYQVHVAPSVDPALTLNGTLAGLGEFDLFIDPTSHQLLELSETSWPSTDTSQSYLHEIMFSKYTATNGVSVPLSITEKFGGQQTWSMTLTSISFNNGLSDSLFSF